MAETMNMMSVTIDEFIEEVENQLEEENYDPMIGIGKSGVGKTMSIYELCQKRGIGFCELRLVTLTEIDMLGIPTITPDGTTTYASNDLLPRVSRDGEEGILVLDEITSASSTVRAAAYQLLDSKRALGNYKLPKKWKVVSLGNGASDGGVYNSMEAAYLSRAVCYRIEPDLDVWKKWAMNNDVNPSIPAFLTFDNQWFHKMDVDEIASIFPCPRSWVALSKMLNAREKRKGRILTEVEVTMLAAGAVGVEAATPFATFYRFNDEVKITPEQILSGEAIKSTGEVGNRVFKSVVPVSSLEQQTVYITIQSVTKALAEKLKGYSSSMPESKKLAYIKPVVNVIAWAIAMGEERVDYAISTIQDISMSVESFVSIVMDEDGIFDEMLPEFMTFAGKHSIVFNE